ncbi:MAG: c-type cytochrome, partial [Deefgea sp.]
AELIARGQQVYEANCAACHKSNGVGGGAYPAIAGSKIATGANAGHIDIVLAGKNAMPAWGALSDVELAAVLTYQRTSWGNQATIIMPAEIRAARK